MTDVLVGARPAPHMVVRLRNWVLYLAACTFVGFALFPLYMMITTSVKTDQQAFAWPPIWVFTPNFSSYYNALFVFGGRGVDHYLLNSLLVTISQDGNVVQTFSNSSGNINFNSLGLGTFEINALTSRGYDPIINTSKAPKASKRFMSETSQMQKQRILIDSSCAALHERGRETH